MCLPAVHDSKVQAIRTYPDALFPAPYLIGLLLELGAPRSGFRALSEYITHQRESYTARTGLLFPRPIPTRNQFDATWKSLTAPLVMSPPMECRQEASYEGAVEGLTITHLMKPLGWAAPATTSTTAPTGAPHEHPSERSCAFPDRPGRHGHHRTRPRFRGIRLYNSFIIRS